MQKLIIGDISGHQDCSGVLFDFLAKWQRSIMPIHLAALLQGKNPWNGTFVDAPPKNVDGLLQELRSQLLSGAKTIAQLKLFLVKKDFTNPVLCRLQTISDFYKEVFNQKFDLVNSISDEDAKKLDTSDWMFFSAALFKNWQFINLWDQYRHGKWRFSGVDYGLERCEPFGYDYGTTHNDFLSKELRMDNKHYFIAYNSNIFSETNDFSFANFKYPYIYNEDVLNKQAGLTLKETYVILMFDYWQNHQYFKFFPQLSETIAIPCFGSTCKATDNLNTFRPIPIIVVDKNNIKATRASAWKTLTIPKYFKHYRVSKIVNINL